LSQIVHNYEEFLSVKELNMLCDFFVNLFRLEVTAKQLHDVQTGGISTMQLDPIDFQ